MISVLIIIGIFIGLLSWRLFYPWTFIDMGPGCFNILGKNCNGENKKDYYDRIDKIILDYWEKCK